MSDLSDLTTLPDLTGPFDLTALRIAPDVHLLQALPDEGSAARLYVNALLLDGPQPVLVDTGPAGDREPWWDLVGQVVDPAEVRWVFLSHSAADRAAVLADVLERCPAAVVVGSWRLGRALADAGHGSRARLRLVDDGERIDLGGWEALAVRPPLYESAATLGIHLPAAGLYWAATCFGACVPHPVDDAGQVDVAVYEEAFTAYHRLLSPWVADLDPVRWRAAVGRVAALGARSIASVHGPLVLRADVARALDLLAEVVDLPALRAR